MTSFMNGPLNNYLPKCKMWTVKCKLQISWSGYKSNFLVYDILEQVDKADHPIYRIQKVLTKIQKPILDSLLQILQYKNS